MSNLKSVTFSLVVSSKQITELKVC